MNNYRPKYHFCSKDGWINDPNGFVYFNGKYHLFFQYQKGLDGSPMSWGHAISDDLIFFEELKPVICHDSAYDEAGSWSGSAIVYKDQLYLIYTGHRLINDKPFQTQNIVISKDGIHFKKYSKNPVISDDLLPEGASIEDFRDPSLFSYRNRIYCLVGNRSKDDVSQLLLYKSKNVKKWTFERTLINNKELGYMLECPSSAKIENKRVLILSPIGLKPRNNEYWNSANSIYIVADQALKNIDCFAHHEIDGGLDFYAAHVISNGDIMISWMQNWGRSIQSIDEKQKWVNCFTLPRKLSLKNNKLIQQALPQLEKHFTNEVVFNGYIKDEIEIEGMKGYFKHLHIEFSQGNDFHIKLFKKGNNFVSVDYDKSLLTIDRRNSLHRVISYKEELSSNNYRQLEIKSKKVILDIYLDRITLEVFVNGGKNVMSMVSYSDDDFDGISFYSTTGKKVKIISKDFVD